MNFDDRIISEAANWAIRVDAGLDGPGQDAFLDWLTADPRHSAEYEKQRAKWARLDILADWRPEHAGRPNRDLLAPRSAPLFEWLRARRRVFAGVTLGALAAAAACVAFVVSGTMPFADDSGASDAGGALAIADNPISTIEQSKLDDGTIVELNRGAAITVMYSATERCVRLESGEVNFHVAKDPSRPFVVNINGVNVRALGTSFNVRRGDEAVEVLVTSGVVQVNADDAKPAAAVKSQTASRDTLVGAGQMAVVSLEASASSMTVQTIATDKIENIIAWHPRQLDISEQTLASAVEEFNRRNAPIHIAIESADLANTLVSATLRSDQVENFVQMLETGFGVRVRRVGNLVTLCKDRQG